MAKYKLGDIAPIQQGLPPKEYPCWLLNLDMVESNTGRILEYLYVQRDEIGSSTISFDTSNVLYSKLRPYLNKVVLPDRTGFATSEMLPLRPDTTIITREYLTYFLRSPHFVGYINDKTSGAKMPRTNTSDLKAVEIECPSFDRQKAIVNVFEHLMSIIDLYQRQVLALDTLIKARFIEMFGDPVSNPKDWPVKPLLDMGDCKNGMNFHYDDSGVELHCLGVGDFQDHSIIDDTTVLSMVSLNEFPSAEYMLQDDDIVFVRSNGNKALVGRCVAVYPGDVPTTFSGFCIRYRKKDTEITIPYLLRVLKTDTIRAKMAGRGANIQNLNQQILGTLVIPVPPMELQKRFASFVSQIDKSKVIIQAALNKVQLLFDSLMQQYFG